MCTKALFLAAALLSVAVSFPAPCVQPENGEQDSVRLLASEVEKERVLAKEKILKARQDEINRLLLTVRSPVEEGEPFMSSITPRNLAISLLGSLRAEEAVPALIEWLIPRKGQSMAVAEEVLLPPAGYALAKIGLPAVGPLISRIGEEGSSILGRQCLITVAYILGAETAEFKLEKAIKSEGDEDRKKNLEDSLNMLKNYELPGLIYRR